MKPPLFDSFFASRKPLAAATALLSRCRQRVLMLENGGLYSLPGGKAEPGESHESAARREFEEETGLVLGPMVEISRFETKFSVVRYVTVEFSGTMRASAEGTPGWRYVRLLGTKARFPKADAELARLLSDGGWSK